jgi:hypothetical protein
MRAARFTGYNHGIGFDRLNTPPSGLTIWQPLLHGMDRVSNDPDILNSNETHPIILLAVLGTPFHRLGSSQFIQWAAKEK